MRHWWNIIKQALCRRHPLEEGVTSVIMPRIAHLLDGTHVRLATLEDIDALLSLEYACYEGYLAWNRRKIQHDMRHNAYAVYLIMEGEDGVVAALIGRIRYREAHLSHLMVQPSCQLQGYGSQLLRLWRRIAWECQTQAMTLEVSERNERAIRLYERHHFNKMHLVRDYYADGSHAWWMTANVKGEEEHDIERDRCAL